MNLQTIATQIRRIQTPDDVFKISHHKNGDVEIIIGAKAYHLNHKVRKMYRGDMKNDDMTKITTISDLRIFLTRYAGAISNTVTKSKKREYEELEILLAYLGEVYDIPMKFTIFNVSGINARNDAFTLKRGTQKM